MAYRDLDRNNNLLITAQCTRGILYTEKPIGSGTPQKITNNSFYMSNTIPVNAGDFIRLYGFTKKADDYYISYCNGGDITDISNIIETRIVNPQEESRYSYIEMFIPSNVEYLSVGGVYSLISHAVINKVSAADFVHITSVSLDVETLTIKARTTRQLVATFNPSNPSNTSIQWASSDTSVLNVSSSGLVTGVAQGVATVTATTVEGNKEATCTITVNTPIGHDFEKLYFNNEIHLVADKQSRDDIVALGNRIAYLEQRIASLVNKTVNCLGDSITHGVISKPTGGTTWTDDTWPKGVGTNLGCTMNNYGVSATSICDGSSESFVTRLNRMSEQSIDLLLVFGGTNDYGDRRAVTLGTLSDSPAQGTNFYASFKYLISTAINKYPSALIGVITPMRRQSGGENANGISIEDIVNAEIDVAKYYGVPLLDFYHYGGINPAITVHYDNYARDGLHPTQAGLDKFLIPMFTEFVRSLLAYRP